MVTHRDVQVQPDGTRLHIAEEGEGPLVVLLHGFPEGWYSWRHQFGPLAAAGFHVVAPDQRGYGTSSRPADVAAYTLLHLAGDVIGLIRALGERAACVVGHDWGAPVAWTTALLRPDMVRAVAGLSVPPPAPRGPVPPLAALHDLYDGRFYWTYFQEPGVAEAEFSRDLRGGLRRSLYGLSGDNPRNEPPIQPVLPPGGGFLDLYDDPAELPGWLTEADLDVFAAQFAASGFTGALNWYRNIDRNWQLAAALDGAALTMPALYAAGDRDLVTVFPGMDAYLPALTGLHPTLTESVILPGCGHWTQQERPAEVNDLLTGFLTEALPRT